MNLSNDNSSSGFYVVGGTMRHNAPSYVERHADKELFDALYGGEFCYILTARQMGKSSLIIRTAARLREAGVSVAALDLTAVGQNLSPDQWYGGLLAQIGQRLGLEDDLIAFWPTQPMIGAMQRWIKAVQTIVLPRQPGRLVIFIDEIDVALSLPFLTDELLAGIRECYNRRDQDPEMDRLTFCLSGVATPSDLIRDTRRTPFNIGRRIELLDFTGAEAAPLARGLGRDEKRSRIILKRILHWTGGHPYLTQRLCQAAAADKSIRGAAEVDRLCEEVFTSQRARERDDNLLFVRERLLRAGVDLTGLLDLYARARKSSGVPDDIANPLVSILRLSGVTRVEAGRLKARNRIYARVFDKTWIAANLPDAEKRRQRAAFRRGLWRAGVFGATILALVGFLAFLAVEQRNLARQQAADNRRLLYVYEMGLVRQEWENANIDRVNELLDAPILLPNEEEDAHGFEWRLFRRLAHSEVAGLRGSARIVSVAFLPEGENLAVVELSYSSANKSSEYLVSLFNLKMRRKSPLLSVPAGGSFSPIVFSPDKSRVAADGPNREVTLWDLESGRRIAVCSKHTGVITTIAFSPDGRYLASADLNGELKLWDSQTQNVKMTLKLERPRIVRAAFSQDGRLLATTDESQAVKLWEVDTGRELRPLITDKRPLMRASFSPKGGKLLAAAKDGRLCLWDVRAGKEIAWLEGHASEAVTIAFSPNGSMVATGSQDRTVRLWDVATGKKLATIRGHGSEARSVAWSEDGKQLATGSYDNSFKIWDVAAISDPNAPSEQVKEYFATMFSDSRELIALGGAADDRIKLWNLSIGRELGVLDDGGEKNKVLCAAFSPNGKLLATGGTDELIKLWDAATGKRVHTLGKQSEKNKFHIYGVNFSPDGETLVSGGADGMLRLWNVASGREESPLSNERDNYYCAVFSPDGKFIASASLDNSVKLWDVAARKVVGRFIGHTDLIRAIAFSPNGELLVTGGSDNTVRLWDTATRQELKILGSAGSVRRIRFSADGKRLITGGEDGSVKLWDVTIKQELMTLIRHAGSVSSITFSSGDLDLATSGSDGAVSLWRTLPRN
jgi:WD40 repeat protein